MSLPGIERPDLPEFMTWEELERLPEEIAEQNRALRPRGDVRAS
ncbi:hypothetical protein [Nocardia salmonicida]